MANIIEEKNAYSFSDEELKCLALFFREKEKELPQKLAAFSKFVETYIYNNLSIAEVEKFFEDSLS